MSYKSTRRQWVKLWVNEWLDGTTRFELTPQQRLLWIDLLALAGRSRFPGFIYAGTGQGNKRVGYPIAYLAGVLQMDETSTNNTLKLLAEHNHITLDEVTSDNYVIGIVNWEKYQSEYLRQRTYRKVTTKTTSRLPVEVEVDVEGEVEVEEKNTPSAFGLFWESYPRKVGKVTAAKAWKKLNLDPEVNSIFKGLERWKVSKEWSNAEFIPHPTTFLNQRRWEESPLEGRVSEAQHGANSQVATLSPECVERLREKFKARGMR